MRTWILGMMLALMADSGFCASPAGGESFPNDLGPAAIDVSDYPPEMRETYKIFSVKCAACHTIARPINSQFLELSREEQERARREDPGLFRDPRLVQVEEGLWKRYVKRMMAKPGCGVTVQDGRKIWEFMVYDSKRRKTGKNAAAWRAHRKKLLDDFASAQKSSSGRAGR